MNQKLTRETFWKDKSLMADFLKEPLNKKLFEIYLGIKRNAPSQDFHTLQLFNEVYYICSRILHESSPQSELTEYISEIKKDMGWDYPTSIVVNMVYVVLSLSKQNSHSAAIMINKIRQHYKMDSYHTPFTQFVNEEMRMGNRYDIAFGDTAQIETLKAKSLPALSKEESVQEKTIHITVNINNSITGDIQHADIHVAHSDVVVGVAEKGSNVFHHKEVKEDGRK